MICKEAAIRTKKLSTNESYYISLLAADKLGKPKDEYYTFDEASKIDLSGTGVKVLDVHQLLAKYKDRHPDVSDEDLKALTVYELAIDLIDAEPKASFFFDECPFIGSSTKWYENGGKMNFSKENRVNYFRFCDFLSFMIMTYHFPSFSLVQLQSRLDTKGFIIHQKYTREY